PLRKLSEEPGFDLASGPPAISLRRARGAGGGKRSIRYRAWRRGGPGDEAIVRDPAVDELELPFEKGAAAFPAPNLAARRLWNRPRTYEGNRREAQTVCFRDGHAEDRHRFRWIRRGRRQIGTRVVARRVPGGINRKRLHRHIAFAPLSPLPP